MHDLISGDELAAQSVELLPERETLFLFRGFSPVSVNVAPVVAVNVSLALNAATIGSTAASDILQGLSLTLGR
ncbi:hypothetical protein ET495_17015 [Xylanimonas allomyrinae]|uniref:Uncharacterized protein n=1 Tax=Xylanimonas allomyrinae TaxID=2509459 RepID=A0A4P6F2M8_9MICO|nr:hypothetical protein [Xylanimonas allomyrinae]QAY64618.1 hypothetical protein ET495_17015 [Xylanimonas allomyrinae]